jgi:kynurenine formamidase
LFATLENCWPVLEKSHASVDFAAFGSTSQQSQGWSGSEPKPKSRATGDDTLFWEAHRVGQRRPYWHMEQLTNLGALPPHGFEVAVFPLKIVGASAAPARVVALFR